MLVIFFQYSGGFGNRIKQQSSLSSCVTLGLKSLLNSKLVEHIACSKSSATTPMNLQNFQFVTSLLSSEWLDRITYYFFFLYTSHESSSSTRVFHQHSGNISVFDEIFILLFVLNNKARFQIMEDIRTPPRRQFILPLLKSCAILLQNVTPHKVDAHSCHSNKDLSCHLTSSRYIIPFIFDACAHVHRFTTDARIVYHGVPYRSCKQIFGQNMTRFTSKLFQ